ncbi:MAG: tRNA 4-thiouridine(8) synthase ThiI, partial [Clostridia bacterium]|nr:tRNA 4-thiouridine(8) synthase ThiI [Clostridia bacterium]
VQEAIAANCEERLFTLLLRRFMVRCAEQAAIKAEASALITGESIGQVASKPCSPWWSPTRRQASPFSVPASAWTRKRS